MIQCNYHTYFIDRTSPGTSWVKESSLGWWEKTMVIGTKSITANTIPIYLKYDSNKSLVNISQTGEQYSDFTVKLLGYLFPSTVIVQ